MKLKTCLHRIRNDRGPNLLEMDDRVEELNAFPVGSVAELAVASRLNPQSFSLVCFLTTVRNYSSPLGIWVAIMAVRHTAQKATGPCCVRFHLRALVLGPYLEKACLSFPVYSLSISPPVVLCLFGFSRSNGAK